MPVTFLLDSYIYIYGILLEEGESISSNLSTHTQGTASSIGYKIDSIKQNSGQNN